MAKPFKTNIHLTWHLLLSLLLLVDGHLVAAQAQTPTAEQLFNAGRNMSVGYVVFKGFTPLDVFGPLEMFFQLSNTYNMTLSVISHQKGPVTARPPSHSMGPDSPPMDFSHMMNPSIVATHSFDDAPPLDILLVSGGLGNFALLAAGDNKIEDFIASRFKSLDYLLSVCIGSVSLARAGVLDNRRATSNKGAWEWVTGSGFGTNVTWVPAARWVQDGKVWTSSGVAAGMDMTYAFLRHIYPPQQVDEMVNGIEYAPHTDPHWDPFAIVNKLPGVVPVGKNQSLADCVAPVGQEETALEHH